MPALANAASLPVWFEDAISTALETTEGQAAAVGTASTSPELSTNPSIPIVSIDYPELIAFSRPAIVQILVSLEGTSTIPAFAFDFETYTWKETPGSKPIEKAVNTQSQGSGFIINPDGYILTNSHVVTDAAERLTTANLLMRDAYYKSASEIPASVVKKMDEEYKTDKEAYQKKIERALLDGVRYAQERLKMPPLKISILKPPTSNAATTTSIIDSEMFSSKTYEETRKEFISHLEDGVAATVIYANEKFFDDERDVAIIKVDQTNLPSIQLGDSDLIALGINAFLFGFPENAERNEFEAEPSFTSGVVNALKDSTQYTFKYIQTDAKSSSGSSGGPLFNSEGKVLGILTRGSGNSFFSTGDSFAFAIPISLTKEALLAANVSLEFSGDYPSSLRRGIELLEKKHCKAALEEFNWAASMNSVFGGTTKYVQPYIEKCNALIAAGESIDSSFDAVMAWIKDRGIGFWSLLGGFVFAISAGGFGGFFLLGRIRREENLIEHLEHELEANHYGVVAQNTTPTAPLTAFTPIQPTQVVSSFTINPQLAEYIAKARNAGQLDAVISSTLKSSGWNGTEVDAALTKK